MASGDRRPDTFPPPVASRPPVALRPPGEAHPPTDLDKRNRRSVGLALAALLLLAIGVVVVLPRWSGPGVQPQPQPVATEPVAVAESIPEPGAARQQAETSLQRYLRRQAALKLERADAWGSDAWEAAAGQASRGDRLFGERQFEAAAQAYERATAQLQALLASRSRRLEDALAAGKQALEANDGVAARGYFEQALLIEENNQEASDGLARAEVRARVMELMASAASAETDDRFEDAAGDYQAALKLDPVFSPAMAGLARSVQVLDDRAFETAVNGALAALDERRFEQAERELAQAAALRPQAAVVADTRQRLEAARRATATAGLRRSAAALVREENWQGAAERYSKALRIDPGAGFAREGLKRAEQRAAVNRQFDHYLDAPDRLFSEQPLANAEQLLKQVPEAPPGEPRLAEKIERLGAAIAAARQPVPVRLTSDGETEVLIYHVGRLGRFSDRVLELRPGTYTAVGSRPGFRDARRVFTLRPGQDAGTFDIRCEEPV